VQIALDFRQEHIPFVTQRKHKLRPTEHPPDWAEPLTTAVELRGDTKGNSCFDVEER
jgi:hypothetical protein